MPNWKFVAAGVFAAFALVLSVSAAAAAVMRPEWAIGPGGGQWWQPAPGNHVFGVAIVVAWGLSWLSFSVGRGVRTFRPRDWLVLQAALTLGFGFASYGPCLGNSNVISVPMWVLNLFVGQVEEAAIGPGAAACPGEYPLAFQVARLLGIGTTALGGVAFLASLSRGLLDRVWVWWASDIDVVAGLNERSVPLIEALVAQRRRERRVRPWYVERWWERVSRRLPGIGGVVVVRRDRDDPLLAEVEAMGVRVIVGDPQDQELHRLVMRRFRKGQVSVRRLFAVSDSQQRNAATVQAALTALTGFGRSTSDAWLDQEFVPRLVARFDDARESRAFRLAHLDVPGCFVDAMSSDELLARELVARFRADRADTAVLVGDSPLTVALLDELALRCALAALPRDDGTAASAGVARPPAAVAVCAATASQIKAEWETLGPSDAAARPLQLTACTGDWEDVVAGLRSAGRRVAVVITRDDGTALSRALRVNRLHPSASVYCWTPTASGVEADTDATGRGVVRIGPTLLQRGGVPEDSWGVLAGAVHDQNRNPDSPRPADRTWGDPVAEPEVRLPDFYREDTLRRQRWVLQLVARQGYAWRPRQPWDAEPALPEDVLGRVAHREHDRWCQWRLAHRWRWAPASADRLSMDRARQNANLVDWDTGSGRPDGAGLNQAALDKLIKGNIEDVSKILTHLYHWGVVPGRLYQRTGTVHATRLAAARSWTTQEGSLLAVAAGDWWVENEDPATGKPLPGTGRGVAASEMFRLHRALDADAGRYQRLGTVTAVQLATPVTIPSLEGPVDAQPGDWVVTDHSGNSWPVPNATFRATYTPIPAPYTQGSSAV